MSNSGGVDKGLLALIQGVLGTRQAATPPPFELPDDDPPAPASAPVSEPAEDATAPPEAEEAETSAPAPAGYDRRKTADELAAIILKALQTLDGAPAAGFKVTVYGGNPWNAMLTIAPAAGAIADPALWRTRVREMAVRLRQDFDVVDG